MRRRTRKRIGPLRRVALPALAVLALIYGLAYCQAVGQTGPGRDWIRLQQGKLDRCERHGADCTLYACYRTDEKRPKFICMEATTL